MVKIKWLFCTIMIFIILHLLLYLINISYGDDHNHIAGSYFCYQENTPISAIHDLENSKNNIPPTVLSYNSDGKYITVMQKPSIPQDVVYRIIRYPDYTETKIYYWIITVSNDSVIGPLCYIDFLTECQDRKISEELRF